MADNQLIEKFRQYLSRELPFVFDVSQRRIAAELALMAAAHYERDEEWWLERAKREGDSPVGAGKP